MNDKEKALRGLRVCAESLARDINLHFRTKMIDELVEKTGLLVPDRINYIYCDRDIDGIMELHISKYRNKEVEPLGTPMLESRWAEHVLEFAKVTCDQPQMLWSRHHREVKSAASISFIINALVKMGLINVLVEQDEDDIINLYINGSENVLSRKKEILEEQVWKDNVWDMIDKYDEDQGVTDNMRSQLYDIGYSSLITKAQEAW